MMMLFVLVVLGTVVEGVKEGVLVFENDDSHCYRIPSVVQTDDGTIVALAESRDGSCSDGNARSIAVKTSSDGGQTFSSNVTLAVGNSTYWVGNPAALYMRSGRIVLVYVKHDKGCTGDCGTGNGVVFSDDNGKTWSEPLDISQDFGVASGSMPGPGTALQTDTGRIMVISHQGAYVGDRISYSDDDGVSWHTTKTVMKGMDEAALTQLQNGSILANMRHREAAKLGRAVSISNDNGESFGPISYDATLISPVCQASIVTFSNVTYFSNPASKTSRSHLTIRKSHDSTASWDSETFLIDEGPSFGYTCLVAGELVHVSDHGGVLYEAAGSTIKFQAFPLDFSVGLDEK